MTPEEYKTMDYEKKYKEALGWMQSLYNGLHGKTKEEAERYFPELKESEDERIRKALINVFSTHQCYEVFFGASVEDILAWLEKQGGQKEIDYNEELEKCKANSLYLFDKYMKVKFKEQNHLLLDNSESNVKFPFKAKVKSNGKIVTIHDGELSMDGKEWIKYQSDSGDGYTVYEPEDLELVCNIEQKTTDKVEPKFKVGDWIINPKTGNVLRIKNILLCGNKGNYEFDNSSMPIGGVDGHYQQWTIKDAKDGDVLYCKKRNIDNSEIIMMYSGINARNHVDSYCRYGSEIGFNAYITNVLDIEHDFIIPATKEQCDLLLSKMKEAGYEWDADKKELKDIEQKPINECNTHEPTIDEARKWNEAYEKGYSLGYENGKNEQKPTERSLPYEKNETAEKLIALAECLEMDGDCLFNGLSGYDYGKLLRVLAIDMKSM